MAALKLKAQSSKLAACSHSASLATGPSRNLEKAAPQPDYLAGPTRTWRPLFRRPRNGQRSSISLFQRPKRPRNTKCRRAGRHGGRPVAWRRACQFAANWRARCDQSIWRNWRASRRRWPSGARFAVQQRRSMASGLIPSRPPLGHLV